VRPIATRRRKFITLICGAAASPLVVRAQQAMPVVEYLFAGSPEQTTYLLSAFRKGLSEAGYIGAGVKRKLDFGAA